MFAHAPFSSQGALHFDVQLSLHLFQLTNSVAREYHPHRSCSLTCPSRSLFLADSVSSLRWILSTALRKLCSFFRRAATSLSFDCIASVRSRSVRRSSKRKQLRVDRSLDVLLPDPILVQIPWLDSPIGSLLSLELPSHRSTRAEVSMEWRGMLKLVYSIAKKLSFVVTIVLRFEFLLKRSEFVLV